MRTGQPSLAFDSFFGGEPIQPVMPAAEYLPSRSRREDPLSSKKAEAECKRTGVMRGQRVICMSLIETYPGRTSNELSELGRASGMSTLDRYQIARRLRELVKLKLVRKPEDEPDYVEGQELRWWPFGNDREESQLEK